MAATRCKAPQVRTLSMATTRTDRRARPAPSSRPVSRRVSVSRFSPSRPGRYQSPVHRREDRADQDPRSCHGQVLATPFLDVSSQILTDGERGLLGLAFDPDFASNGFFYVYLINLSGDAEIRRYHVSSNPNVADPASVTPIITIDQTDASNHKAGWLGFGPDGYLYIATGDGGSRRAAHRTSTACSARSCASTCMATTFPAIPRATTRCPPTTRSWARRSRRNLCARPAQPVAGQLRPRARRLLHRRCRRRPNGKRSISARRVPTTAGPRSRARVSGGTPTGGPSAAPIHFYDHSVGQSITGGYVYRGEAEALQGQYFFADFVQGKVFTLRFNGTAWVATERTAQIITDFGAINNPSSFGEDARGNLYLTDFDGEIFRLTPTVASADQADVLRGLGGNDMLFGGSGDDTLDGGPGADTLIGRQRHADRRPRQRHADRRGGDGHRALQFQFNRCHGQLLRRSYDRRWAERNTRC